MVENGVRSGLNLNAVSSGFSEWNMEFNGMNLNSNVDGTKSLSDQSLENGSGTNFSTRVDSNVNDLVLDGKSREVKAENGFDSSLKSNAESSGLIEWNMDFNQMNLNSNVHGMQSLSDQSQKIKSENSGLSIKSNGSDPYQDGSSSHHFGGWTFELNKFSSSANTLNANVNILSSNLDTNVREEDLDGATFDDDKDDDEDEGWEFKDAYSEWRPGDVNNMVDTKVHDFYEKNAHSSGFGNGSIDLFGTANQSIDLFSTSTGVDLFSTSSDFHSSSQEVNLFEVQSSIAAPISFISDANLNIERTDIKDGLNPNLDVGYAESDDGFGEFTTAFSESEPKSREALDDDIFSPSKEAGLMLDGKVQGKETKSNNHKGALPLSIFGDEEPETNGHVDVGDAFMHQPTSYQRTGHASNSVTSVNDLISNLYSKAEQASSVDTLQKPIEIKLNPSDAVSNSDVVYNDNGDFNDNTWEFMGASSEKRNNDEASLFSVEDDHLIGSSKLQLNNFVDFYSRLMDELCFIAEVHIERLKNARSNAALSDEFAEVAALDNEILEASKELDQMNVIFKEDNSLDHPSGESYLKEFIEVLLEPKFLVLESEYHLSEKLLLVERDLSLAIELIKHTTTMIKILKLGALDEQQMYVTTWSKIISVCSQELKHGSLIWKQAIEKKIQSQILSESQGREFILALGEIYRVVVILEASAKIFKPWTISCWSNIDILLEECHTLWSTSGFEEALMSVSESSSSDDASLMNSIKYISGLDAFALQNSVFTHESLCRLSILSVGAVPGMKMIMWENEQYFVTLANLWANLVSHDPPEVPHLHIGR
ncbi:Oligopeptide transporter 5 [Olea europaea subsp. europaea]|uniref:Oligopeptide transporter 5 n=1 Tax=Olea europaea subsp. europaea TaxID=158383 RepID=A0A8S0RYJ2_OLEEU|nr:Oligopeptide transporter 5 [Olea europaea subsp. europaea]